MYAEQDAKVMTCPLSIGVQPVFHPTDGQGVRDGGPWPCIGSGCMAWRWVITGSVYDAQAQNSDRGYCGMAGKP